MRCTYLNLETEISSILSSFLRVSGWPLTALRQQNVCQILTEFKLTYAILGGMMHFNLFICACIPTDGAIEEDCPEDVSDQASNGPANPYGHRR